MTCRGAGIGPGQGLAGSNACGFSGTAATPSAVGAGRGGALTWLTPVGLPRTRWAYASTLERVRVCACRLGQASVRNLARTRLPTPEVSHGADVGVAGRSAFSFPRWRHCFHGRDTAFTAATLLPRPRHCFRRRDPASTATTLLPHPAPATLDGRSAPGEADAQVLRGGVPSPALRAGPLSGHIGPGSQPPPARRASPGTPHPSTSTQPIKPEPRRWPRWRGSRRVGGCPAPVPSEPRRSSRRVGRRSSGGCRP
jgi:hypothetical protein